MASNDEVMTTADFNKEMGEGKPAKKAAKVEPLAGTSPYVAAQTVAINNRGVVMYLEEGQPVDLFENEAEVLISMGYINAPEPPDPEARKGVKEKPETAESKTPKAETR